MYCTTGVLLGRSRLPVGLVPCCAVLCCIAICLSPGPRPCVCACVAILVGVAFLIVMMPFDVASAATQARDDEFREEFKMTSFVSMTKGIKQILIPLNGKQAFDVVEKWPLVQAFALEDVGGGGFFTLKHTVTDATPVLHALYHHTDHLILEKLVKRTCVPLLRHWNATLRNISAVTDRKLIDGNAVAEPLIKYYSHSTNAQGTVCAPRFEVHKDSSGDPTHMVCEFRTPDGPVTCARTIMFESDNESSAATHRALRETYLLLIELARRAVDKYTNPMDASKPFDTETISQEIEADFQNEAVCRLIVPATYTWEAGAFTCAITAQDMHGKDIPLQKGDSPRAVKSVHLSVNAVGPGSSPLGQIVYGESFYNAGLRVLKITSTDLKDTDTACVFTHTLSKHLCVTPCPLHGLIHSWG